MSNGKLIAVWGNNSSGKTTTAAQLASQLAENNQEVLLVLTDITAPDMKVILPHEKNTRSMGNIWSTPDCSIDAIYKACVVTDSDNICLLGYRNSENVFTNPDYTKDNIMDVFMKLKSIVDYVIVDCASEFAYNVLTTVALEMADKVLRLGEATPKAFSFFDSNLSLLQDSRYKSVQHIKVLSKVKSFQPKELAISHYGGIDVELPYTEAIERKIMEGELLQLTNDKSMKAYNAGLIKIMDLLNEPRLLRVKQTVKKEKKRIVEKEKKQSVKKEKQSIEKEKQTFEKETFMKETFKKERKQLIEKGKQSNEKESQSVKKKLTIKKEMQSDPDKTKERRQKRKDTIKKVLKGVIQYD